MRNILYYIYLSLCLDWALVVNPFFRRITTKDKAELMVKKYLYFLLIILGLKKVILGKTYISLFGQELHASEFGLERFQTALIKQGEFLSMFDTKEVATVIDIGANIGNVSLAVSKLFPDAKIYAIEPVFDIYKILKKSTTKHLNIYTFPLAISNNSKSVTMLYNKKLPEGSLVMNNSVSFKGKKIHVKALTLDSFIKQNHIKQIDYLKIDVESFEKNVLQGAHESLGDVHYLCLEIQATDYTDYTFSELVGMLYGKNYNFQLLKFHEYPKKKKKTFTLADCLFENIKFKQKKT